MEPTGTPGVRPIPQNTSHLPPGSMAAVPATRGDAPRRCFICLTDEDPSDPPSSWVDPCPCTLEAHQDCMLSWLVDCERSNKPLQCPVCKSEIGFEGPWDPVVAVHDAIATRFTRASPLLLVTGLTLGVQVSSQMYGATAMWLFAGKDALIDYMFGDSGPAFGLGGPPPSKFERIGNAAVLMNVAPALLIGQLIPGLGNKIFVPAGSMYGIFHFMTDDDFFTWPPSPQLAMAVFPYIRSIYYNLWREFVFPYEVSLNRQILGLPPPEPRRNDRGRDNQRNGERNADGGFIGFLQTLLDALDPDEEEQEGQNPVAQIEIVQEEIPAAEAGQGENEEERPMFQLHYEFHYNDGHDEGELQRPEQPAEHDEDQDMPQNPEVEGEGEGEDEGEGAAEQAVNQEEPAAQRDAVQAPPAQRPGLGSILSNISNALVSALILPGISFAMGEALRLLFPKAWTAMSPSPYFRRTRPGLLQQQWGRSLVGGCIFVVMKDVVRLYSKHRKVMAMSTRRVKNVDRGRRAK